MSPVVTPDISSQELTSASDLIRQQCLRSTYDHRPFLDPNDEEIISKQTEFYRRFYAGFKYTVAKILQPRRIVEVGVGCGTSALAFAAAVPDLHYIGIDSGEWATRLGHPFLEVVESKLAQQKISYEMILTDSRKLDRFPTCGLCHIDGDHSYEAARHDMIAAWHSGTPWILIDDAKDSAVVAGVFHALKFDLNRGSVDWAYFNTWGGDILIRTDHKL